MQEMFITVRYTPGVGAAVKVEGNVLGDRVLAHGLLEAAKDAIRTTIDKASVSPIVAPSDGAIASLLQT